MKQGQFEKYVDMIRSKAWHYAKVSGVEYEEVEAQGFLIYCECLEKYDVTKSNFSTYLYIQLNRLGDFVKTYNRQKGILLEDMNKSDYPVFRKSRCYLSQTITNDNSDNVRRVRNELVSVEDSVSQNDLLEFSKEYLSCNAYKLLAWIVGREWEKKGKRTPTVSMAMKQFKETKENVSLWWQECSNFWKVQGSAIYA